MNGRQLTDGGNVLPIRIPVTSPDIWMKISGNRGFSE